MTPERALEIIKDELTIESDIINEALKIVGNAVEKQIKKRPNFKGDGYDECGELIYDVWICPNCDTDYEVDYDHYNYCPHCGQALNWSIK